MGSTGPADAATEAFIRYLAAEVRATMANVTCGLVPGQARPGPPGRADL